MYDISNLEMIIRLCLAVALAAAVGLERELKSQPAGLRTHIAVALGAALIMLLSKYGFVDVEITTKDPARLAAQVVSGIGFLGAGMIIVNRNKIRGLTTAASLWTTAAIGLAVGAGFYLPAITTTLLLVLTLVFLKRIEGNRIKHQEKKIKVIVEDVDSFLSELDGVLTKNFVVLNRTEIKEADGKMEMMIYLKMAKKSDASFIISDLIKVKGVKSAEDVS